MTFKRIQILYYILLIMLALTVLLLAFVIPYGGYIVEEPPIIIDDNGENIPLTYTGTLPSILENATVIGSYESSTALITIYTFRVYDSDVIVADVIVKQAEVIRSGLAFNMFGGSNYVQTVSEMAQERNAIFAINADWANHYDRGLVIKNGQILRSTISYRDAIALYSDGTVSSFAEKSTTANRLIENNAWQVWSFGPVLVKNSIAVSSINDGIPRNAVNNPRSAFGWISDFHYMFVAVNGRTDISKGVDVEELADIMLMLNSTEAYNFDGGSSSTMYFDGQIVNAPSSGVEREVGDIVYIVG